MRANQALIRPPPPVGSRARATTTIPALAEPFRSGQSYRRSAALEAASCWLPARNGLRPASERQLGFNGVIGVIPLLVTPIVGKTSLLSTTNSTPHRRDRRAPLPAAFCLTQSAAQRLLSKAKHGLIVGKRAGRPTPEDTLGPGHRPAPSNWA